MMAQRKTQVKRYIVTAGVEWYEIERTTRTYRDEPVRAWVCWHLTAGGARKVEDGWYRTKAEAVEDTTAMVAIRKRGTA